MTLKNVLILYKKSAYKIYFLEKRGSFSVRNRSLIQKELGHFKKAHDEHYATLREVERVLCKYKIHFTKAHRHRNIQYSRYDLVITIGGDGTFLEAARDIDNSVLLGVNSSLSYSVGKFCPAHAKNFQDIFTRILRKNAKVHRLERLHIKVDGYHKPIDCLNDVLVCHKNPAAMSRYALKIGQRREEQRGSGLWIAAPAGSSGAIHSAGGQVMPQTAKEIQYMPRELYWGGSFKYRLKGGVLSSRQSLTVISLMRQGRVYIDGTHLEFLFPFGAAMKVTRSPYPVKTIGA